MVVGLSPVLVPLYIVLKGGGVLSGSGIMARLDSSGAPSEIKHFFPDWGRGFSGAPSAINCFFVDWGLGLLNRRIELYSGTTINHFFADWGSVLLNI